MLLLRDLLQREFTLIYMLIVILKWHLREGIDSVADSIATTIRWLSESRKIESARNHADRMFDVVLDVTWLQDIFS